MPCIYSENILKVEGNVSDSLESTKRRDDWGKGVIYGYTWFFYKQLVYKQLCHGQCCKLVKELMYLCIFCKLLLSKKQISEFIDLSQETVNCWCWSNKLLSHSRLCCWKGNNSNGIFYAENGNSIANRKFKSWLLMLIENIIWIFKKKYYE